VSARDSRRRKKEQQVFLQEQLTMSNEENRKLKTENQSLLQQSEALHAEVLRLRAHANQEAMTTRAAVAAFQQQQQNIVARLPTQQARQELDTAIRQQALRRTASIQQQQHDAAVLQQARQDVIGSLLRAFARRSGT
jgi:hypothetical protein